MSVHLALEPAIDDEGGSIDHLAYVVDDGSFASASDGARVVRAHAWAHDSSSTSAPEMNDGADDDEWGFAGGLAAGRFSPSPVGTASLPFK